MQISKAKLSSNQSCILVFEDIPGRVSVNGRIECIGCNHPSEEQRAKKVPNTMLAFFVQSVSTFAIEDSLVNAPLRYNKANFKMTFILLFNHANCHNFVEMHEIPPSRPESSNIIKSGLIL